MKEPLIYDDCPDSWKLSFNYDKMEVFGSRSHSGYYYAYQNRFRSIVNAIKSLLSENSTILDLAAGSGNISLTLAEAGYKIIWNDLRAELVPYVQMKQTAGNITYLPGNIFELQQPAVDAVVISEIIEHVAHPDDFLKKVSTMVKPGGYVFLSTPLGNYFLNRLPRFTDFAHPEIFEKSQFKPNADGHIFLLHLDEIIALAEKAGLSVSQIRFNNNPLTSGHIKLRHVLKWLPSRWVLAIEQFTGKLPQSIARKLHSNIVVVLKSKQE